MLTKEQTPLASVVMPALNEAAEIERAIAAARRSYGAEEVEIIVVDGGSSDGTPDLVPAGERLLTSNPGRAVQMNCGARAARGRVLLFCHADSRLPAGWLRPVLEALDRPGVSGGSFLIRLEPERGILYLLNRLRYPPDWRLMYGDQAPFMTRAAFESVGGFPELPLMEDLEMMRLLHRVGRLVRLPLRVTSSSRRFLERGPLRQFARDVSFVLRYLYLDADPEELARSYYGSRRASRSRDGEQSTADAVTTGEERQQKTPESD